MSRGVRGLIAFGGIALILGLACAAARWWVGESWTTVIAQCCFAVAIGVASAVGARRRKQ